MIRWRRKIEENRLPILCRSHQLDIELEIQVAQCYNEYVDAHCIEILPTNARSS